MSARHAALLSFAVLVCSLSAALAQDASTLTKSTDTKLLYGEEMSGQALVDGDTKGVCDHFERLASRTSPDVRNLLMTDRSLTKFYSMTCVDECDLEEMNNALVHCSIALPVENCVFYAGIYQNHYFSMGLFPDGRLLPDICLAPKR